MTRNQIAYVTHLEQRRANQAQEQLTRQRDATTRELGFANLSETSRHNTAVEQHNVALLEETSRANRAREEEARRANIAAESETRRANLAREAYNLQFLGETIRANQERETQNRFALFEQQRSNLIRESETLRSNLAREAEISRANRAQEAERNRAALEQEQLERMRQAEAARHNRAAEAVSKANVSLGYAELSERKRAAQASEGLQLQRNETEATRVALGAAETERAHRAQEEIQRSQLGLDTLRVGQSGEKIQIDREYSELEKQWRPFESFTRGVGNLANAASRISPFLS